MKARRVLFVATICLALLGGRGGSLPAQTSYKEVSVTNGGTIRGRVRLACEVPKGIQMMISKDEKYCGTTKPSPRISLGKSGGVRNAIVWLEGVTEGKMKGSGSKKLVLDQSKCEYSPHILLLPFGSSLDIVNSDPVLHNVHTYEGSDNGKTLFNIAQPIKGQRTAIKGTQFKSSGLYLATCDAGHPWMSAYIIVAEHPYYALTEANGNFVLDNVPPGTYRLKMWHEGVAVVKTEMEKGKPKAYRYESPYEAEKEVAVSANENVSADFSLVLRAATSDATTGSKSPGQ